MSSSSFPVSLLITLLGLIAVLALAWYTLRFVAGLDHGRLQSGRIKILQSTPVGTRERLVLARVGEQEYLLGVTAGGISIIEKLDMADSVKNQNAP